MRVINCTQSVLGVHGITIPAGQHRNVRDFDPDNERNQALLADGSIQVPALSTDHGLLAELDESELEEPNLGDDEPNLGKGWFHR